MSLAIPEYLAGAKKKPKKRLTITVDAEVWEDLELMARLVGREVGAEPNAPELIESLLKNAMSRERWFAKAKAELMDGTVEEPENQRADTSMSDS